YDRILQNIARREVNIHWVVTRPMLERSNYFEQYVSFWNARPEVNRIWVSFYTPQKEEKSAEMRGAADRRFAAATLAELEKPYPKLSFHGGIARAALCPPEKTHDCVLAKMSANYSAYLRTRDQRGDLGATTAGGQSWCRA